MSVSQTQQVTCSCSSSASFRKVEKQDHSKDNQANKKQYDPDFGMEPQPSNGKGQEEDGDADDKGSKQNSKEQDPTDKASNQRNVANKSGYWREEQTNACHEQQIACYSQTSSETF